jgi:hypothetical protein
VCESVTVHITQTRNSTQIITLSRFYIVTHILNLLCKTQHFIFANCFSVLCNASCKQHLPEDGHNRWPKHVGGCADKNVINMDIYIRFLVVSHKNFVPVEH